MKKLLPEDLDFISDVAAAGSFGVRLRYHLILIVTALFFIVALIWAANATLDEMATGQGKVIPSSKIQVIQNLEGGILSEVLVGEGDVVEKDQPLMRLDDTRFASTFRETEHKYQDLLARVQRLSSEVNANDPEAASQVTKKDKERAQNQQALYDSRQREVANKVDILKQQKAQKQQELNELRARIDTLRGSYNLAKQELTMSEPLVQQGAISPVEILRLQRTVNDIKGEMDEASLSIPRLESAMNEINRKMEDVKISFRTKALDDLTETNAELAETKETLLGLKDRVTRTLVRSPVKGIVKQLKINTIGGVVQPGMDLMEIVPLDDSLLIEAQIKPSDIAFIHPGQAVVVKISAYDYSIYGGLDGELEHISADTITDQSKDGARQESNYRVLVRTQKSYLGTRDKPLNIIPGMTAVIDIKTGKKTVLDYLLKPILKIKERALTEH
jgi:adhesin transport system membrane fusion protein